MDAAMNDNLRDDNRIENLELWSNSHPSGQRVDDKVAWAKKILETYPNWGINKEETNGYY